MASACHSSSSKWLNFDDPLHNSLADAMFKEAIAFEPL